MSWLCSANPAGDRVDVVPLDDLIVHDMCGDCDCGPAITMLESPRGDAWQYVHHSLDGREAAE